MKMMLAPCDHIITVMARQEVTKRLLNREGTLTTGCACPLVMQWTEIPKSFLNFPILCVCFDSVRHIYYYEIKIITKCNSRLWFLFVRVGFDLCITNSVLTSSQIDEHISHLFTGKWDPVLCDENCLLTR